MVCINDMSECAQMDDDDNTGQDLLTLHHRTSDGGVTQNESVKWEKTSEVSEPCSLVKSGSKFKVGLCLS